MAVGVGRSGNGYDGHHRSDTDEGARGPLALVLTAVDPVGEAVGHEAELILNV